jgi:alkaline phosphatase D
MSLPHLLAASLPAGLSRRHFLAASAAAASWSLWSLPARGLARAHVKLPDQPFQLGIASGDPASDGFVLWTRLAPRPLEGDGGMPAENVEVKWRVATDEKFAHVVKSGVELAVPENAHAVHAEVAGLAPDRWYFYQFEAAGEASPIGRARTLLTADALPEKLKFAFASCQHFETGYFPSYEFLAREGLDLAFHLGDYIYENGGRNNLVRKHLGPEIMTLAHYRVRHAQYKTDPDLQAAHAACPWFVTWDDHEVDNNYANDISEQPNVAAEDFLKRRANAYKAYYEHMPLRRASLPRGPDMQLYRSARFGRLAEFFVLDTRQYRTDQPCGDGRKAPCAGVYDENATMLGDAQEAWLNKGLAASPGTWNVLAQQVMMARVDRLPGEGEAYSMDQWPGYEVNRRRMLKHFEEAKIANPVVLTGDIHTNWVNDLVVDFDERQSRAVGTEFVATSISSGGNGVEKVKGHDEVLSENPFVKFFNAERGYVSCEVTPTAWTAHYRVTPDVTQRHTPVITRASFVVEAGRPGAERA